MPKKLIRYEFIEKAKNIHGDTYDYSLVNYFHSKIKVKIICKEHGEFEQSPNSHMRGKGCKRCGGNEKISNSSFIIRAKEIHGEKYDYSKVNCNGNKNYVTIICYMHGEFEQTPKNHLNNKQGCIKCGYENMRKNRRLTKEEFLQRAFFVHKNKYDYSNIDFLDSKTPIQIYCPEHGIFNQQPSVHMRGVGCMICGGKERWTIEKFIEEANKIHDFRYNYGKSIYLNTEKKLIIICKEHGEFLQSPHAHIGQSQGCKKCKASKGEKNIRIVLENLSIKYIEQHKFKDCINPKTNHRLSFDFYLPDYNMCVEYDGIQHFNVINFFGGMDKLIKTQEKDILKNEYCFNKKIKLLRINYVDNVFEKLIVHL